MAKNTTLKASRANVLCKIKDIQPDPMHSGRRIISIEFDDGDKLGPWHQAFSIVPEQIISVDDFINKLMNMEISRPLDPYKNITKLMMTGETFVLNLTNKIESGE